MTLPDGRSFPRKAHPPVEAVPETPQGAPGEIGLETMFCVGCGHHVAGYSAPCAGGSARTKGHHPVLVSSSPGEQVRRASGLVHDEEHSHGEGSSPFSLSGTGCSKAARSVPNGVQCPKREVQQGKINTFPECGERGAHRTSPANEGPKQTRQATLSRVAKTHRIILGVQTNGAKKVLISVAPEAVGE